MRCAGNKTITWLTAGLASGLLFMGALRFSAATPTVLTPLAGYATTGYIAVTVLFAILFTNAGLPHNRFGFGSRLNLRHVLLALAAIAALRLINFGLSPWVEQLLGGGRDLERFAGVEDSVSALALLLVTNWTFAAFGEEFAYRILLMRAIAFVLGDTRVALICALLLQAVIFGLVHAYQGPAGIVGSAISGLVFGAITIAARWSIWPAALAHGGNNTFGIIALYLGAD